MNSSFPSNETAAAAIAPQPTAASSKRLDKDSDHSLVNSAPQVGRWGRYLEWSRLIALTSSAQFIVQAVGFVCGIIVIRLLSVEQYALYTISNTMLSTMTILADSGISSGVISQGGKVWQDRTQLGKVISTGFALRKQFAAMCIVCVAPILLYLLRYHGASWLMAIAITSSLVPALISALSNGLYSITGKLHQEVRALQSIQVTSNLVRLGLTGITLFLFPFAFIAIAASGLSHTFANIRLRRLANQHADLAAGTDAETQHQILQVVRRRFPNALYFCFSSQLTVWIVSVFGTTTSLADMGALTRLSVVNSIVVSTYAMLSVPRFARLSGDAQSLRNRMHLTMASTLIIVLILNAIVWIWPHPLLWILGNAYADAGILLRWSFAATSLGMLNMIMTQMMDSRGLIIPARIYIPLAILTQIIAYSTQDISKLSSVFRAAIISTSVLLLLRYFYFRYEVSRSQPTALEASN